MTDERVDALRGAVVRARAAGQATVTVDVETLDAALALVPRREPDPLYVPSAAVTVESGLADLVDAAFDVNGVPEADAGAAAGEDFLGGREV